MARATYERWLTAHRLTGLFVSAAAVHGAIVDPVLYRSILLRVVFLSAGSLGVIAYGDYTHELFDKLRPGVPAKLAGPFGGCDHRGSSAASP